MSAAHSVRDASGAWICSRHPETGGFDERGPHDCLRCDLGKSPDRSAGTKSMSDDQFEEFAAAVGLPVAPTGDITAELLRALGLDGHENPRGG